ncbi:hypothetical protein FB45DRAFT_909340 [Roridomyces roridus]|uniref:Uncharacterized protein n=1 Tax=Roridomyces roridus TaxID=1738132 RepID=A0AAD7BYZ0_9AGAR|nr:hypothetical protein FB45DRAFT_909340 [Roridomyces roridus]
MRRMMSVFRLNPFAMHTQGGRGVLEPWAGGEARPLEEEPRIFEFQLDLLPEEEEELYETKIERFDDTGLRAFSPEYEPVPQKQEEPDGSSWELYPALSPFDPVLTCPRSLHYDYTTHAPHSQPMPRRWSHPSASFM